MSIDIKKLKNILEAAMMAMSKPMNIEQMMSLFEENNRPSVSKVKDAIKKLQLDCEDRGIELKEVASGYRYQARQDYSEWLSRLWEEKPAKYSRAYLETLALIAYRQPVTRAEIEDVRGVGVSSSIVKTMLEREWIRVVGHRDVPGRPSLYATTRQFLDYFNMKSLDELPSLAEIRDLDDLNPELGLNEPGHLDESEDSAVKSQTNQNDEAGSDTVKMEMTPDAESTSFETETESGYEVVIEKENISKIDDYADNQDNAGLEHISLSDTDESELDEEKRSPNTFD